MDKLAKKIRDIPDFPQKGILFKDITPLLQDAKSFQRAIRLMAEHYQGQNLDLVVSTESRGFILGGALSCQLGLGFIPVRKPGKLPFLVESITYQLEYGEDTIEIHQDSLQKGDRILVFDDVVATGGTALATCQLVERLGGEIAEVCFLVELAGLKGREKLRDYPVFSLIRFD